ncbi:MAG: acyl-CoA thioesterase [Candidatus Delongbacteria bacterium]|nr:acyl-CoA thioesterase [Candidatus Delongbacteria bacterium]
MGGIVPAVEISLRVRYAETDAMRIAYHANYLVWYEMGRNELMRVNGLPYRVIEERGYIMPVLEAGSQYIQSALYDDELVVRTTLQRQSRASVRLDYEVLREGVVINRGFTRHCFLTLAEHKLVPIPAFYLEQFNWE